MAEARAPNFYELLNVSPGASLDEIRIAYHAAVLSSHPDRAGDDPALFVAQQQAWETLRDESSRRTYDDSLAMQTAMLQVSRILEEVSLDETSGVMFVCRCGGHAQIDQAAGLPQVVSCDGCSLQYRIVPAGSAPDP